MCLLPWKPIQLRSGMGGGCKYVHARAVCGEKTTTMIMAVQFAILLLHVGKVLCEFHALKLTTGVVVFKGIYFIYFNDVCLSVCKFAHLPILCTPHYWCGHCRGYQFG